MRRTRALAIGASCLAVALGVAWAHDQVLWNDESSMDSIALECAMEVAGPIEPRFELTDRSSVCARKTPLTDAPIGRIGDPTFAIELVGALRGAKEGSGERTLRTVLHHAGYRHWVFHSVQLDGEAERIVDVDHRCDMGDDMWLRSYF